MKYRTEQKYVINYGTYILLKQRLSAVLQTDPHAGADGYLISSLYFDDIYKSAYFDKLNGDKLRRKYRIRTYNNDKSFIRLECKRKADEYNNKTSITLTYEQYRKMLHGDYEFAKSAEFENTVLEDFIVSDNLVKLYPSVTVTYHREAYICPAGNVRITLDKDISASYGAFPEAMDLFSGIPPTEAFPDIVLEIKYDQLIPDYISGLFSGLTLSRMAVSKYAACKAIQLI